MAKQFIQLPKKGASEMVECLNQAKIISDMIITTGGGGIRGSLLTTIYLIIITLIIAHTIRSWRSYIFK